MLCQCPEVIKMNGCVQILNAVRQQQSERSLRSAPRQPPLDGGGTSATPMDLMALSAAQRKWIERFRQSMHVCGVGDGPRQVRERHVALVSTCLSGWDAQWESKLSAIESSLKWRGAVHLQYTYGLHLSVSKA